MITVKPVMAIECRGFIEPMLEAHYREVGNTKLYKLDPDYAKYAAVEAQGGLIALVAFQDDVPVGYSVNFLTAHPHYKESKVCYNDVLFVAANKRGTIAGAKLMAATKLHARAVSAMAVQWHAKPGTLLDTVLKRRVPLFENCYVEAL